MIFAVKRKGLLEFAKKVSKAVSLSNPQVELQGIHLAADTQEGVIRMTATNYELTLRASYPAEITQRGDAVINTSIFLEILSLMPDETLRFESKENVLAIIGEKVRYDICVLPGENYPKVEMPVPFETVFVGGLKGMIRGSAFAASNETENPVLNCIRISLGADGIRAFASDCVGMIELQGDRDAKGNISMLFPAAPLKTLASIASENDIYEFGVTGNGETARTAVFSDGTLLAAIRLISGEHIDPGACFGLFDGSEPSVTVMASDFKEGIDIAATMVSARDVVGLFYEDGQLDITCETGFGNSGHTIPAETTVPPMGTRYFAKGQLLSCARTLKGTIRLAFSGQGHLLITGKDVKYFQLCCNPHLNKIAKTKKTKAQTNEKKAS